jgi:hypothetical protein
LGEEASGELKNLPPEEIRRRIDEALAEIDEVEEQVLALFTEVGGPDVTRRVLEQMRRAARQTRGRLEK